jgi:hypothetical protein
VCRQPFGAIVSVSTGIPSGSPPSALATPSTLRLKNSSAQRPPMRVACDAVREVAQSATTFASLPTARSIQPWSSHCARPVRRLSTACRSPRTIPDTSAARQSATGACQLLAVRKTIAATAATATMPRIASPGLSGSCAQRIVAIASSPDTGTAGRGIVSGSTTITSATTAAIHLGRGSPAPSHARKAVSTSGAR